jgi:RNA polymerase sigma-70 factor (ECF subfamily)
MAGSLTEMITGIANGDKNALRELYEQTSKDIYTFLLIQCKDKNIAEDALQETFISIYENAHTFKTFANPKAWILTIARNKAISIIRKNSYTYAEDILDVDFAQTENIENITLDKMQADSLLSILSGEDRQIVILHAVHGLKHRETAKIMNLPVGTVTWRYKRSIDAMRKAGIEYMADISDMEMESEGKQCSGIDTATAEKNKN